MQQQTNLQPPGYNEIQQQHQQQQQQQYQQNPSLSQQQSRRSIIRQIFNLPTFNSFKKKHRKASAAETSTQERITNSIPIQNEISSCSNNNNQMKVLLQQDDTSINRNIPSLESQRQQQHQEFTDYQLPQEQYQKSAKQQQLQQYQQQQQAIQSNVTSKVSINQQELITIENKVPVQQQQQYSGMVLEQSAVIKEPLGEEFLMNGDSLDIQLQALLLGSQLFNNNMQQKTENEPQLLSISQTIQLEQTRDYALDLQDINKHEDEVDLNHPLRIKQQPSINKIGKAFKEQKNHNNSLGDNRRCEVNMISNNNNNLISSPPQLISCVQGYSAVENQNPCRDSLQKRESNKKPNEFNQITSNNCLFHPPTDSQSKNNHNFNSNGIIFPGQNIANISSHDSNLNCESKARLHSDNDLMGQFYQNDNLEQYKRDSSRPSQQLQLAFKRHNSENNNTAEDAQKTIPNQMLNQFQSQVLLLNKKNSDNHHNMQPLHTILSSNNFNIQSSNHSEHYEWSQQIQRDNKIRSTARVKRPKKRPVSSQFNHEYVSACLPGDFLSIDNNKVDQQNHNNTNDEFFSLLNAGGQQQFLKVDQDLVLPEQQVGLIARSSERLAFKRQDRLHSQASSQSTNSQNSRLDQYPNQTPMNDQLSGIQNYSHEQGQQLQQNQNKSSSTNVFTKRSQSMPELIEATAGNNNMNIPNQFQSKGGIISNNGINNNNNNQKSSHYFKCGLVQKNPSGSRKYCGGYGSQESKEYFGLDGQHQQYQSQIQRDYLTKQGSTSVSRAQSHHDHYNNNSEHAFSRCYSGNKNNNGNASNIHSNACAVAAIQPLNFRRLSKVIKPPSRRETDSSDNRDSSKKTNEEEQRTTPQIADKGNLNSRLKRESTKKYFFCYSNSNSSKQQSSNCNNPSQSQQSQLIARNSSNNNSSADSNILYSNSHFKVRNSQQKRRSQPSLVQVPDSFSTSKQQQQLFSYQPTNRNSSQHSQSSSSRSSLHQTIQQLHQQLPQPSKPISNNNYQLNTKKKVIYPLLQQAQSITQSINQLSTFPYSESPGDNYESVPYLPVRQSSATSQQQQSQQANTSSAMTQYSKHLQNASNQLPANLVNGSGINSSSKANLQTEGNFSKSIYSCLNNTNNPPAKTVLLQHPLNQQAYAAKIGIADLKTKLFGKSESQRLIDGKSHQQLKQSNQPQQQQINQILKLNTKSINSNGESSSSRQQHQQVSPLRKKLIMGQNGISQTDYLPIGYDDYQQDQPSNINNNNNNNNNNRVQYF